MMIVILNDDEDSYVYPQALFVITKASKWIYFTTHFKRMHAQCSCTVCVNLIFL